MEETRGCGWAVGAHPPLINSRGFDPRIKYEATLNLWASYPTLWGAFNLATRIVTVFGGGYPDLDKKKTMEELFKTWNCHKVNCLQEIKLTSSMGNLNINYGNNELKMEISRNYKINAKTTNIVWDLYNFLHK
jgi:arginine decarboxylase-like protein